MASVTHAASLLASRIGSARAHDLAQARRCRQRRAGGHTQVVERVDVQLLQRLVETPVAAVQIFGGRLAAVLWQSPERAAQLRKHGGGVAGVAGREGDEISQRVSVLAHGQAPQGRGRRPSRGVAGERRHAATRRGAVPPPGLAPPPLTEPPLPNKAEPPGASVRTAGGQAEEQQGQGSRSHRQM